MAQACTLMKNIYRVVPGTEVGKPNANFLVVNQHNQVISNDAGFPSRKRAESWRQRLEHCERGAILLREAGEAKCQSGYGTTDPEWVGRYGLAYGDINSDGTLN